MYNTNTHFHTNGHTDGITIRLAVAGDRDDLHLLAERDSRELPAGAMLVAVVAGHIRAATPVSGEEPISDPFSHSSELVDLLNARVEQLRGRGGRGLRARLGRVLGGRSKARLSPQPAGTLRAFE
jgi:hypothetical protein